jgi:polyhydroxyalkanoate synthase subunit PhaC
MPRASHLAVEPVPEAAAPESRRPPGKVSARTPTGAPAAVVASAAPPAVHRLENFDRLLAASASRLTGGISPNSVAMALFDWLSHLAMAPGMQMETAAAAGRNAVALSTWAMRAALQQDPPPLIEPAPGDRRFRSEAWRHWPFNFMAQGFLLNQQWLCEQTCAVRGLSPAHADRVHFMLRQWLDLFAPPNLPFTNPEVIRATIEQGGQNFARGFANFIDDVQRAADGRPPAGAEKFVVGRDVAVTPGKVVYRNELVELIQYAPSAAGGQVRALPILIVPAWIMKYYILDLSPHNSLIKHLVDRGYTVFCISWLNPTEKHRDVDLEDYRINGIMEALGAVGAIVPERQIHTVGYCLGGTLSAIAAAAMARDHDGRMASLTLLAAQTDFTEAGELSLFIDESQVTYLEDMMWDRGYLDRYQMAGAFQMLRSNDLIWSRLVREYMLGERHEMTDLMAWNADATRLPFKMHSQYLRRLFLDNSLATGRYKVHGRPVALTDIRCPVFAVATDRDHVSPWRSVYKIALLTDTEVTFLLTNGGHNAGIVSEPGHRSREYRVATFHPSARYTDPEAWRQGAPRNDGSWWPAWMEWLDARSGPLGTPPGMGNPARGLAPLCDAPGIYVLQP